MPGVAGGIVAQVGEVRSNRVYFAGAIARCVGITFRPDELRATLAWSDVADDDIMDEPPTLPGRRFVGGLSGAA